MASAAAPLTGQQQAAVPPRQAASSGYTRLDFSDEFSNYRDGSFIAFHGRPGTVWSAAAWYKPGAANPSNFSIVHGALTIRDNEISTIQNSPPFRARSWTGGYFEARLNCDGFCGFYLGSAEWARLSGLACKAGFCSADHAAGKEIDAKFGGANEIDIVELYAHNPRQGQFTVHKSGMGAGQQGYGSPDEINKDNHTRFPFALSGAWHTYGLLWTKEQLSWYVDNKLVKTARPFTSTWQPAFITLDAIPEKGYSYPSGAGPVLGVKWVKVWE